MPAPTPDLRVLGMTPEGAGVEGQRGACGTALRSTSSWFLGRRQSRQTLTAHLIYDKTRRFRNGDVRDSSYQCCSRDAPAPRSPGDHCGTSTVTPVMMGRIVPVTVST